MGDLLDLDYDCVFERTVLGGKLAMVPRQQADRGPKLALFVDSALCPGLAQLEAQLGLEGNFVGFCSKGLCSADLAIFDLVKTVEHVLEPATFQAVMDPFERIRGLVSHVGNQPEIIAHLQKYPNVHRQSLFTAPDLKKRTVHAVLFPVVKAVLGAKMRYSGHARDLIIPALVFSTVSGL